MLRSYICLALLASAASLRAQPQANYMELGAALQAAQAQASRPGDASLDCSGLEKELTAAANDPALQAHVQASGDAAQERAAAASRGAAGGTSAAVTLFSSIVPGGAMAGLAADAAKAQAQQAEAAANMQTRMQQMQAMLPVLPQLMRGQRILELAQAHQCPWVQGAMAR